MEGQVECNLAGDQSAIGCEVPGVTDANVIRFECARLVLDEDGRVVQRRRLAPLCPTDREVVIEQGMDAWFRAHPEVTRGEDDFRKIFDIWASRHSTDEAELRLWSQSQIAHSLDSAAEFTRQVQLVHGPRQLAAQDVDLGNLLDGVTRSVPARVFSSRSDEQHHRFFRDTYRLEYEVRKTISADENYQEVVGHMRENMDLILSSVPDRVGDIFLLPAQRMAVYHATTVYPFDRIVRLTMNRPGHAPIEWEARLPENTVCPVQILSYGTGMGKTTMALLCGLRTTLHEPT